MKRNSWMTLNQRQVHVMASSIFSTPSDVNLNDCLDSNANLLLTSVSNSKVSTGRSKKLQ